MPQGASLYPISQLIDRIIRDSGYSSAGFISTLGHPVAEPGLNDLESWLKTGEGNEEIIAQIAAVYTDDADELTRAVRETAAMKAAGVDTVAWERQKEKEKFRPYIHADGQRTVPSGITIFGVTGGYRRWNTIQIPKAILELPLEAQLEKLPELMAAYEQQYNGACPFFGRLTGFKLVRLTDYLQFDADGRLLEHVENPFLGGDCWVELR